jgi:hypothetical protein
MKQLPRRVEYPHAVCQAAVGGTGKHEIRKTELLYPSKPLGFRRIQKTPCELIEVICTELDEVVNRISDSSWL